jgi:hypothetical protein
MYNIIERILDSEHKKIYKIMIAYVRTIIITEDMDIISLFLEDHKIIKEINILLLPVKDIINDMIAIIMKEYIVISVLAKILLIDYKQGEKLLGAHYIAIKLRAHNILRKAQIAKMCS